MAEPIRMRRFPDREEPKLQGVATLEAKAYGAGAFSWDIDGNGVRWLLFRYPDKIFHYSDGRTDGMGSVPVRAPGEPELPRETYPNQWEWDGNEDEPTVGPSIAIRTTRGRSGEWEECFHGYVRGGWLEVL